MPTVTEIIEGRSASIDAGGTGSEGIQRRYSRKFRVIMAAWEDPALRVATCPGIPRVGEIYQVGGTADTGARCFSLSLDSTDEPRQWTVTAEYSTRPSDIGDMQKEAGTSADPNDPNNNSGDQGQGGDSSANDPINRPAQITYSQQQQTKIATKGVLVGGNGATVPIASSAGEPFDPPVEIFTSSATLTIVRAEASFSPTITGQFTNKVNSATFLGEFDAGTVRCAGISAVQQNEGGRQFWQVTYSFEIRDTWTISVLDQGFYEIVGGAKTNIVDANGDRLSSPWPLDGAGQKLSEANVAAGNFHYREFSVYDEIDFSILSLP